MTTLSDLIMRLEAAKEGSRELDAEIAVEIFETQKTNGDLTYAKPCTRSDNCAEGTYWHVQRSGMSLRTAPLYTTSLDAALTLVPKEYGQNWDLKWRNGVVCRAELYRPSYQVDGLAATPALALCIAALKAREAAR